MVNSKEIEGLHIAAQLYLERSFSVIPTYGKRAAVPWKEYQRRKPSIEEVEGWYTGTDFNGIAIVTGNVSDDLAVLDFDDEALFDLFKIQCPRLLKTHIVRTRRGHHIYLRMSPELDFSTSRISGLDVQYEGRYVIAPPSDHYTLVQGGDPLQLDRHGVERLNAFLKLVKTHRLPQDSRLKHSVRGSVVATDSTPGCVQGDLRSSYSSTVALGRNNALFQAACLGRDHGMHQDDVIATLIPEYIKSPPLPGHVYQTDRQREREGINTIQSAFTRPACPINQRRTNGQLSNVIREKLMMLKLTCLIRVLDGLRIRGIQPGQEFTRQEANQLLKGTVGERSIRQALEAMPVGRSASLLTTGNPVAQNSIKKCFLITRKKRSHRNQQIFFIMPSNKELASRLAVDESNKGDTLTLEDLKSAKSTRQALERAYIERQPGQYPMQWFANRLGVTPRTIRNYHQASSDISFVPLFSTQQLSWDTLDRIPDELPHGGMFLEDEKRKRYPAKIGIEKWLLGQKKKVFLKRRLPNFWYIERATSQSIDMKYADNTNVNVLVHHESSYIFPQLREAERRIQQVQNQVEELVINKTKYQRAHEEVHRSKDQKTKRAVSSSYSAPQRSRQRKADELQRLLAQKVHKSINAMTPNQPLSLETAMGLVETYSSTAIEYALARVQSRTNVRNPAGLLITILRSENRDRKIS